MRTTFLIATLLATSLWIISCGEEEDDSDSEACTAERSAIEADADAINFCDADADCASSSVNPHYGCYIHHNKDADPKAVLARIDAYSDSSCWDGMTTLTTLKCPGPGALPLVCSNRKCVVPTLLTNP